MLYSALQYELWLRASKKEDGKELKAGNDSGYTRKGTTASGVLDVFLVESILLQYTRTVRQYIRDRHFGRGTNPAYARRQLTFPDRDLVRRYSQPVQLFGPCRYTDRRDVIEN